MSEPPWRYLVALGSNVRHPAMGAPPRVVVAAMARLDTGGTRVIARSRIMASDPVGPSLRRYANAAVVVETALDPPALLSLLHGIERDFGRRRVGQKWRARTLDLDIVLWSGGRWNDRRLTIPHAQFRGRDFVLRPACAIARDWRDPVSGLSVGHLCARVLKQAS
ncbi:2-amino-4-hydroxy-6-hydroxymethyldihydropteridine diphosphokinase [Croceicoccus hydrothermalis]|uniref:2-amino-4-hydroxy-6- hydroxymethyldihydropteridine diphosphokinase n=1 Tax=Croceicoccus hydrothermalis TaxID=2867964 RepID=UPI001EFB99E5|nr:2-amino-4-hydroxy-6-hydroxymethyldihydropteridine diphosphokinase [Croceicoccus hydrothermalis]